MSGLLFKNLYYYAQIWGADREVIQQCRKELESNGATSCGSPGDPRCTLIIVAPPVKTKGYTFTTPGEAGDFEAHQKDGTWTFDALCTHFARRATGATDNFAIWRKRVVVVGWVKECLEQGKLLTEGRYALYEIIAEDRPSGTPTVKPRARPSAVRSGAQDQPTLGHVGPSVARQSSLGHGRPRARHADSRATTPIVIHDASVQVQVGPDETTAVDHSTEYGLAEPEATLTPEPNLVASALMQMNNSIEFPQMPPSPPLTATSSMSRAGSFVPRVFDSLTQDRWGSRSFFVACQGIGAMEYYIKANGGMLDERTEATFIIVDAPIDGHLSFETRSILGDLRRSQKAIHPGWIDECVRQNAIANFEPFIVTIPFETISSASQLEECETMSQTIRDPSRVPTVESLTVKGKRRQSQMEIDGSAPDVNSSSCGTTQSSAGTIPKATDPRVRPRLSTEVTSNPPSWYRPPQHSIPLVIDHHETAVHRLPPRVPSPTATDDDAQRVAGPSYPRPPPGPPVTPGAQSSAQTSLSLKPLEGLSPFTIPSDKPPHSSALPSLAVPSSSQTMMDLDTIKAEQPDPTTVSGTLDDDLAPQSARSPLSLDTSRARTTPDPLFHGLSPSNHLAGRPSAVTPESEKKDVSRMAGPEVKTEDVDDHVEVKMEAMDTRVYAPFPSSTIAPGPRLAELARQPSGSATPISSKTTDVLPPSSNDAQLERSNSISSTSASVVRSPTDAPGSSNDIRLDNNGPALPEPTSNQTALPLSEPSRTASPLSPLPPDLDDDGQFSDTLSTTSSEVSAISDTTCPSDDGSPPPIILEDEIARSPSSKVQIPTVTEPQFQPLLVTQGRAEGRTAKGPPTLVEAARLNELIKDFDKWLKTAPTCTATQFVRDVEKKKTKFGWMAMFERKRSIIRDRLLLKGYRVALLDSLGFYEEIVIQNAATSTLPSGDPTGHGVDRPVKPRPSLQGSARLERLVSEFDRWLKAGPVGHRWDLTKSLNEKEPGYQWDQLYRRKPGSVRTALLALDHKAETLDAVSILDLPDPVYGQKNERVHTFTATCNQRVRELANDLDGWLRNGAQGKRSQYVRDVKVKKPGCSWTNLYRRKRHSIFHALLAMGHEATSLNKADIHDIPDVIWPSKHKKGAKVGPLVPQS